MNPVVREVTRRIAERSREDRGCYLEQIRDAGLNRPERARLSCGNLAHGFAACNLEDKNRIRLVDAANIGIVTAYNDMLSAHQPYADFPTRIKRHIRELGSTAQVAGGVPAMCDGITQGQAGMELSLFSRDNIAQATAIALSHQMFDGVMLLGICDKIVPGLFIGALRFGHIPAIFVPAGPMPSGISNQKKATLRQRFAEGKIGRDELLDAEAASYHSPGTCTFYGTANSNQLLMEAMGLQLPGGSFVNPNTPLRDALTGEACRQLIRITAQSGDPRPVGEVIDERSIVNAIVALLATGGSTNHSIHLVAMARAAGIHINWDDFDALSKVVPLLCRIYPNGEADINDFHAAGGAGFLFRELLTVGLLHGDARTSWGENLADFTVEPELEDGRLVWRQAVGASGDPSVLRSAGDPFANEGGLRLLRGNLGRGMIKISAVAGEHRVIEAPAVVVDSQQALKRKYEAGELERDCVAIVRFQGPRANGMPELHSLTPLLGSLQGRGFKVALITDGRMSGASGKVPAAIHLSPEAAAGGLIGKLKDGDMIRLDTNAGTLDCLVDAKAISARTGAVAGEYATRGVGRELFANFRHLVSPPEMGATVLFDDTGWTDAHVRKNDD
ncbi:MAG: phosphogluconate dehydratase [Gammaproteobacteria bacterium]|nr:phosphogluconate dehydratase [Gammaproteobacteria bacterium]MYE30958.1 phosphogluconate dehydratase [Gammaproteobacteria bacterium]